MPVKHFTEQDKNMTKHVFYHWGTLRMILELIELENYRAIDTEKPKKMCGRKGLTRSIMTLKRI